MTTKSLLSLFIAIILTGCDSRETKIKNAITRDLQSNPKQLFDAFHPVGTGRSVKVHSVQVGRNGADVTFTIYWRGPITSDGYTKVAAHYDAQVQRWTRTTILATNGITNGQANEAAFNIGFNIGRTMFED